MYGRQLKFRHVGGSNIGVGDVAAAKIELTPETAAVTCCRCQRCSQHSFDHAELNHAETTQHAIEPGITLNATSLPADQCTDGKGRKLSGVNEC
jgi:hypothetical protein